MFDSGPDFQLMQQSSNDHISQLRLSVHLCVQYVWHAHRSIGFPFDISCFLLLKQTETRGYELDHVVECVLGFFFFVTS